MRKNYIIPFIVYGIGGVILQQGNARVELKYEAFHAKVDTGKHFETKYPEHSKIVLGDPKVEKDVFGVIQDYFKNGGNIDTLFGGKIV